MSGGSSGYNEHLTTILTKTARGVLSADPGRKAAMTLDGLFEKWEQVSRERFGNDWQIISEKGGFRGRCTNCCSDLHLSWNEYGNICLKCEGGCQQSDILEGFELEERDLCFQMRYWDIGIFRLFRLAKEKCEFTRNAYGQPVATVRLEDDDSDEDEKGESFLVRSGRFQELLANEYWGLEQRSASGRMITAVQRLVGGETAKTAPVNQDRGLHRLLYCLESFAQAHSPSWVGTMSELFSLLPPGGTQPAPGDDWPGTARGLRSMIEACSPEIAKMGIEVTFGKRLPGDGKRSVTVRKLTTFT